MNENINLCEILKGLEGIELYSSIFGHVIFKQFYGDSVIVELNTVSKPNYAYDKNGKWFNTKDSECTLFPSKEQRDWSKFERPIPVNTPMMCSDHQLTWHLKYYSGFFNGKHRVHCRNYKDNFESWEYIIPYYKFDPNNIEESLKYNIQK